MAKKPTPLQTVQSLAPRFDRIRAGVLITDALLCRYYDKRAEDIETFNASLQAVTTTAEEADAEADSQKAN